MKTSDKYILVPFELTGTVFSACKIAFTMAIQFDMPLVLLHVTANKRSQDVEGTDFLQNELQKSVGQELISKCEYRIELRKGVPEDVIADYINENEPALVIMATRSKVQKKTDLIGSVTAEVVNRAKVPVMVFPSQLADSLIQKSDISVAYSISYRNPDFEAFQRLLDLLSYFNYQLTLVHVLEEGEVADEYQHLVQQYEEYLQQKAPNVSCKCKLLSIHDTISTTLNQFAIEQHFDFVVLKNPQRFRLNRIFVTTLAQKMVYKAQNSLIIV